MKPPEFTIPLAIDLVKNNAEMQVIYDADLLSAQAKAATTGFAKSLGLPASRTEHLLWENIGAAYYIEQLLLNYYLPSLGSQTPAPATKRGTNLAEKVAEISRLNGAYPKCKFLLYVRSSPADAWVWAAVEVIQNYGDRANFLNLLTPYLSQGNLDISGKKSQIGIKFISEAITKTTLPQTGDFLTIKGALRLELSKFDSGVTIYSSKIEEEDDMPRLTGEIIAFGGTSVPDGWLLCDGSERLISIYPALYQALDTTYGALSNGLGSAGATHFRLPDLRGRAGIGAGAGAGLTARVLGAVIGAEAIALTEAQMPAHTHVQAAHTHVQNPHAHNYSWFAGANTANSLSATGGYLTLTANAGVSTAVAAVNQAAIATNNATGSGAAHNNMPPCLAINYLIYAR